jgi:hypothetical protein
MVHAEICFSMWQRICASIVADLDLAPSVDHADDFTLIPCDEADVAGLAVSK